jgi:hypothetical protein
LHISSFRGLRLNEEQQTTFPNGNLTQGSVRPLVPDRLSSTKKLPLKLHLISICPSRALDYTANGKLPLFTGEPSNPWGLFPMSDRSAWTSIRANPCAKFFLATVHGQYYAKSILCAPNPQVVSLSTSSSPSGSSSPSFTLSSFDSLSLNPVLRFELSLIILHCVLSFFVRFHLDHQFFNINTNLFQTCVSTPSLC